MISIVISCNVMAPLNGLPWAEERSDRRIAPAPINRDLGLIVITVSHSETTIAILVSPIVEWRIRWAATHALIVSLSCCPVVEACEECLFPKPLFSVRTIRRCTTRITHLAIHRN